MLAWYRAAILCGIVLPLHAQSQPPDFPKAFAGHAQFETTAGFRENGWASLAATHSGSEAFILSVRHLLGPESGFPHQVSVAEAPSFVRNIKIDSFSGGTHSYIVGGLPIPSPDIDPLQSPISGLVVYRLHNGLPPNQNVVLAANAPAVGETVWLMTKVGETAVLKSMIVVSNPPDTWLGVQLKTGTLDKDESGAPVLNNAGELVGIYSHRDAKNPSMLDLIPAAVILQILP
jgi:hypothetical protein